MMTTALSFSRLNRKAWSTQNPYSISTYYGIAYGTKSQDSYQFELLCEIKEATCQEPT